MPGAVWHRGRHRHLRENYRGRDADWGRGRSRQVPGRDRRRRLAIWRQFLPRRVENLLWRHLLPASRHHVHRARGASPSQGAGTRAAIDPEPAHRRFRRNLERVFYGRRFAHPGRLFLVHVPLRVLREFRAVLLSHARKGCLHLGMAQLLSFHGAHGRGFGPRGGRGQGERGGTPGGGFSSSPPSRRTTG